ncbi:MAG: TonB-dependent receptor [Bacteroidales bacterium]
MQKHGLILLFAALNILSSLPAQQIFHGRIKSPAGEPVSGVLVNITSQGIQKSSYSQSDGRFRLEGVPYGEVEVSLTKEGLGSVHRKVNFKSGGPDFFTFVFPAEAISYELDEVVITGTADPPSGGVRNWYPVQKMNKVDLQRTVIHDGGDFLRGQPNIGGIRKGGTQLDPVIRGFKYSQLNIVTDHSLKVEQGCPNRMDPPISHTDPDQYREIEVIKGPYGLRYGPSFGATIRVSTLPRHSYDTTFFNLKADRSYESGWNGNSENISVFGNFRKGYIGINGGRKIFGNYTDGNGNLIESSFNKNRIRVDAGVAPAKNQLLSVASSWQNGKDIRFPSLPMDERTDRTRLYQAEWRLYPEKGYLSSLRISGYRSDVHHVMDNKYRPFSDTVVAVSTIDAQNYGGRAEIVLHTRPGVLTAVIDHESIKKDGIREKSMIRQPGLPMVEETLWKEAFIRNTGVALDLTKTSGLFSFILAGRLDYNRAGSGDLEASNMMGMELYFFPGDEAGSEYTNLSFSGGIEYKPVPELQLVLSAGRGVRSPDMNERFITLLPVGYDNFDYLGNPALKPEVNNQLDAGIRWLDTPVGTFNAGLFFSRLERYIRGVWLPPAEQKPRTSGVTGVKRYENSGNALLYGFEFSWDSPRSLPVTLRWSGGYTTGTLDEAVKVVVNESGEVTGTQVIKNDALEEIPPFDTRIEAGVPLFDKKLYVWTLFRWVAAQNHVSQSAYESTTPGFLTADVNVNWQINRVIFLAAGVSNLFDQAYYEHLNRNIVGSNLPLYEPGRSLFVKLQIAL